ncbi:MAG: hypothetical protein WBD81_00550 [Collimonas pratensis]|uniref:hypothetical protein n=1 Tax=Collimonas pratensis TaxID=279113 RepID=UPI003C78E6E3
MSINTVSMMKGIAASRARCWGGVVVSVTLCCSGRWFLLVAGFRDCLIAIRHHIEKHDAVARVYPKAARAGFMLGWDCVSVAGRAGLSVQGLGLSGAHSIALFLRHFMLKIQLRLSLVANWQRNCQFFQYVHLVTLFHYQDDMLLCSIRSQSYQENNTNAYTGSATGVAGELAGWRQQKKSNLLASCLY